jgi:hypothetical protein
MVTTNAFKTTLHFINTDAQTVQKHKVARDFIAAMCIITRCEGKKDPQYRWICNWAIQQIPHFRQFRTTWDNSATQAATADEKNFRICLEAFVSDVLKKAKEAYGGQRVPSVMLPPALQMQPLTAQATQPLPGPVSGAAGPIPTVTAPAPASLPKEIKHPEKVVKMVVVWPGPPSTAPAAGGAIQGAAGPLSAAPSAHPALTNPAVSDSYDLDHASNAVIYNTCTKWTLRELYTMVVNNDPNDPNRPRSIYGLTQSVDALASNNGPRHPIQDAVQLHSDKQTYAWYKMLKHEPLVVVAIMFRIAPPAATQVSGIDTPMRGNHPHLRPVDFGNLIIEDETDTDYDPALKKKVWQPPRSTARWVEHIDRVAKQRKRLADKAVEMKLSCKKQGKWYDKVLFEDEAGYRIGMTPEEHTTNKRLLLDVGPSKFRDLRGRIQKRYRLNTTNTLT